MAAAGAAVSIDEDSLMRAATGPGGGVAAVAADGSVIRYMTML